MTDKTSTTLDATDLGDKANEVVDKIQTGSLDEAVIRKEGKTIAVVTPAWQSKGTFNLHEILRGTVIIPEGFDITAPAFEGTIHAEEGRIHE